MLFELQVRRVDYLRLDGEPDYEDVAAIENSVRIFLELNTNNMNNNVWSVFQLARMCVRYAHYDLAQEIYSRLSTSLAEQQHLTSNSSISNNSNMSTSDVSYKSWFDFMANACRAEHLLSSRSIESGNVNELIAALNDALSNYMRAQVCYYSHITFIRLSCESIYISLFITISKISNLIY